jgi:uncharacterized protein DUF222
MIDEREFAPAVAAPEQSLEAQLTGDAGHMAAAMYRWLVRLAAYDRSRGWAWWGCRSAAHWLTWHCGVDLGTAREQVKVAHRLGELPLVSEAFRRGELSWSQVRLIARVATEHSEEGLLRCARWGTTAQLGRIVAGLKRVYDLQAAAAGTDTLHRRRSLRWWFDDDGFLVLAGKLAPEEGAVVARALEALVDDLVRDQRRQVRQTRAPIDQGPEDAPGEVDDRWGATRADALVRMARLALAESSQPIRDRAQVVVHVDAHVLAHRGPEEADGRCEVEDGPALSRAAALRLTCDAAVVTLLEDNDGMPLDVGRRTRSVPPAIRRALRARGPGMPLPRLLRDPVRRGAPYAPLAPRGQDGGRQPRGALHLPPPPAPRGGLHGGRDPTGSAVRPAERRRDRAAGPGTACVRRRPPPHEPGPRAGDRSRDDQIPVDRRPAEPPLRGQRPGGSAGARPKPCRPMQGRSLVPVRA